MANWILGLQESPKEGKVSIFKDGQIQPGIEKRIYPIGRRGKVEFAMVYNSQGKMLGYQLKFANNNKIAKSLLFNYFGVFYNPRKEANPKENKLEILFEDQVVRLLAFTHKTGVKDYVLIGRWRTESETPADEVPDAD